MTVLGDPTMIAVPEPRSMPADEYLEWEPLQYDPDDEVPFESLGLTLTLEQVYEGVQLGS